MKIYLTIKVRTHARKQEIEKKGQREYHLRLLSSPQKGEANQEVCKLLASHFGLPSSRIKIVRGEKSQHKIVSLEVEEEDLARFETKMNPPQRKT